MERSWKQTEKLATATQEDWLRFTAYLECEGTIHTFVIPAKTIGKKSPRHSLVLKIHNVDPRLPFWCMNHFGGRVRAWSNIRKGLHVNHEQVYEWAACSREAERILRGCLPYFLIKKEQAEIAILLRETMTSSPKQVSEEVLAKREELHQELRGLKHELPEAAKAVIQ